MQTADFFHKLEKYILHIVLLFTAAIFVIMASFLIDKQFNANASHRGCEKITGVAPAYGNAGTIWFDGINTDDVMCLDLDDSDGSVGYFEGDPTETSSDPDSYFWSSNLGWGVADWCIDSDGNGSPDNCLHENRLKIDNISSVIEDDNGNPVEYGYLEGYVWVPSLREFWKADWDCAVSGCGLGADSEDFLELLPRINLTTGKFTGSFWSDSIGFVKIAADASFPRVDPEDDTPSDPDTRCCTGGMPSEKLDVEPRVINADGKEIRAFEDMHDIPYADGNDEYKYQVRFLDYFSGRPVASDAYFTLDNLAPGVLMNDSKLCLDQLANECSGFGIFEGLHADPHVYAEEIDWGDGRDSATWEIEITAIAPTTAYNFFDKNGDFLPSTNELNDPDGENIILIQGLNVVVDPSIGRSIVVRSDDNNLFQFEFRPPAEVIDLFRVSGDDEFDNLLSIPNFTQELEGNYRENIDVGHNWDVISELSAGDDTGHAFVFDTNDPTADEFTTDDSTTLSQTFSISSVLADPFDLVSIIADGSGATNPIEPTLRTYISNPGSPAIKYYSARLPREDAEEIYYCEPKVKVNGSNKAFVSSDVRDDYDVRQIGKNIAADTRNRLLREILKIQRNANIDSTVNAINLDDLSSLEAGSLFSDGEVLIIDSTGVDKVFINPGSGNSSVKTVVVVGADVVLTEADYGSSNSAMGLIALKDLGAGLGSSGGNVYIEPDVVTLHMNIFADGSLLSCNEGCTNGLVNIGDRQQILGRQLHIIGSVVSSNTIGASNEEIALGSGDYLCGDGGTCELTEAVEQDLWHLRYFPQCEEGEGTSSQCDQGDGAIVAAADCAGGLRAPGVGDTGQVDSWSVVIDFKAPSLDMPIFSVTNTGFSLF